MAKNCDLNLKSTTLKCTISGLRGIVPNDINPENIPAIAGAIHKCLGPGPIAIARDNRPTGEAIQEIVAGAFRALGRDIHMLNIVPTPTIKAFVNRKKLAGGVMISASHNPEEYNAFKMIKKGGEFFEQKDVDLFVKGLSSPGAWKDHRGYGAKIESQAEAIGLHIDSIIASVFGGEEGIKKTITNPKRFKIAVDTLGACAAPAIEPLLKRLNLSALFIYPEVLNRFPRKPEPTPDALKKFAKFVKDNKCDIGFAFDPDADRLAIVGPDGPIGEELTLPLAMMAALKKQKGKVVVNLSSSFANNMAAKLFGCETLRSKVGEAHVTAKMKKLKAVFGGEGNGGVIDPKIDSYGRDALAGVAWILRLMHQSQFGVNDLLKQLPALHIKKSAIKGDPKGLKELTGKLNKELKGWGKITEDGFYYHHPEGLPWIHIRASNTEPIIRIIAEASSKKELNDILKLVTPKK